MSRRGIANIGITAISGIRRIGNLLSFAIFVNIKTLLHSNNWLVSRRELEHSKQLDLKYATSRQLSIISVFFSNLIYRLGKKLMLRQIPIATANIYFKRFYLNNALCETDPFMLTACCVYVAAKVDETPVHIKSVVSEARATFSGEYGMCIGNFILRALQNSTTEVSRQTTPNWPKWNSTSSRISNST